MTGIPGLQPGIFEIIIEEVVPLKKLILAEKPSVAKNIADATGAVRRNGYFEGEEYLITWAFGHLLQLFDARDYDPSMKSWRMEKFPFIPDHFRYKLKTDGKNKDKADAGVVRQMETIKSLMQRQDVDGIISATDDDREGQIIADEVWGYLKPSKPVERILLNEWTGDEVRRGLANLKPNEAMSPLRDAGFGRQIADWLIGINLTSVATLKSRHGKESRLLNVGRVLMPTLKIIYDRDKEIENFKVTKYYKLRGFFKPGTAKQFEATYYVDKNEKFDRPEELKELAERIRGLPARITDKKVTRKKEYPPYLFNLSNLQGHITSKNKGWTSDKVLKTAQDLYEKKLITYPRTASLVLDESLIDKTRKVLETHRQQSEYADEIKFHTSKRVFDSKKVESHSAIIPTYMLPKKLSDDEQVVYDAIRNRFLAQFMPIAESEDTELVLRMLDPAVSGQGEGSPEECGGGQAESRSPGDDYLDIPGYFQAKGKVQLVDGWKKIEGIDSKDSLLPNVSRGEIADLKKTEVKEIERKPPKPHTEKSLLKVMETCGKKYEEKDDQEMMMAILSGFSIGTPATRAETIKKLKTAGYIRARGKSLTCTDLGRNMVETFPARELFDLEYTGRLEKTLADIEKKKHSRKEFLDLIEEFVKESVEKIKKDPVFGGSPGQPPLHTEPAGLCPECGHPVMETDRAFGCSNWRNGCHFAIWKNDYFIESLGKKVSYEMVKILLEHGKVGFHGCVSKKGNKFSAYFYYEKDPATGRYKWRLDFIG